MEKLIEYLPFILIGITGLISYKGFNDRAFYEKYLFSTEGILGRKEYIRFISSGFLHADWQHLIFNMITLYFFSNSVINFVGPLGYLIVYFGSKIGGGLLSLLMYRDNPHYRAIGASGAVSGIVFAAIALHAGSSIYLLFIPIGIPGWVYALGYTLYSIYGIKTRLGNIGHAAHLGGGVSGMLIVLVLAPALVIANYLPVVLVLVPTIILIVIMIKAPHLLLKEGWLDGKIFRNSRRNKWKVYKNPNSTIDEHYNEIKREKEKEVDRILEKISAKGVDSLTRDEKNFLDLNS